MSLLLDSRIALWAFDFDGNILAPETITYVIDRETGEEVSIPAHTLDQNPELMRDKYRWKDDILDSLLNFRDYHSNTRHLWPDQLKHDTEEALQREAFAPSLQKLKDIFLVPARLFAIITSRGHWGDNLTRIMWIINETLLSDAEKDLQYQNICSLYALLNPTLKVPNRDQALRFYFEQMVSCYPVSNPHLAKYMHWEDVPNMSVRKTLAMDHLIHRTNSLKEKLWLKDVPLSIGFSDDSLSNIEAMIGFFIEQRKLGNLSKDTIHIYFTGKQSEAKKLQKYGVSIEFWEDMATVRI